MTTEVRVTKCLAVVHIFQVVHYSKSYNYTSVMKYDLYVWHAAWDMRLGLKMQLAFLMLVFSIHKVID